MSKQTVAKISLRLHAEYNIWFNKKLFSLLVTSKTEELLLIQLNHIHAVDCLWLTRLGVNHPKLPKPNRLDERRFSAFKQWYKIQKISDQLLKQHVSHLSNKQLRKHLFFSTMAEGHEVCCPRWGALVNLYNHQALHRGEIISILRQRGIIFGQSDLLPFVVKSRG